MPRYAVMVGTDKNIRGTGYMKLGSRELNEFSGPFFIAEIGSNHNGDMELAKQMIAAAKDCGCDAVKFQSWSPGSLIAREEYDRNQVYNDSPKKHFGSLKEMVEKYYLRPEQHFELNDFCRSVGIGFSSTPFSREEADLLENIGVEFYKIASMDINNLLLIQHIARKRKPLILSTGMASLAEIETAIKIIEQEGNNQIILLHCIAIYPPDPKDINLHNIPMLRQTFGYEVGFSDHSIGTAIPLAAVTLGARIIEKHFTLNKELPGWDHEISADPPEMRNIIETSRKIISALGSFTRVISKDEEEKKKKFRRSIVAARDLKAGDTLKLDDLTFKRPGTGIRPDEYTYILGRTLNKDLQYDELIHWDDVI